MDTRWAARVVISSFGVRIRVCTDDRSLWPLMLDRLPPHVPLSDDVVPDHNCSLSAAGHHHGRLIYQMHADAELVVQTPDREFALAVFESALRSTVSSNAVGWVFVHAGSVAWKGRGIIIPAPSEHGKSTLVAALLRLGATYYSDEFAVLDRQGRVHAFPKPLSLREEGALPQRLAANELGAAIGSDAIPIAVIAATSFAAGAPWPPPRGSRAAAVLALLGNTVAARSAPGHTMQVLTRAVKGAVLLEGTRPEASLVAASLLEIAERAAGA